MAEKQPSRDDELEDRKDEAGRDKDGSEERGPVTPSDVEEDLIMEDRFEASDN
jgi:hypothetical protein